MNRNQIEVHFFSDKNVDILLQIIDTHLTSEFGYKIKQDEEHLLFEIMKLKYEQRRPIQKNENIFSYVKQLNQDTLKVTLNIIKKKLNQDRMKQDTSNAYEKIKKERQIKVEKPKEIDFRMNIDEDNEVIKHKFKKVLMDREHEEKNRIKKLKSEDELVIDKKNEQPMYQIKDIQPNPEQKVIQSLPEKKYEEIQEHTFIIDSRERNNVSTTNPNSYTIQFDKPFKNIVSLELLSTELPITQYVVNAYNNQLKIDTDTITITKGNYTSSELASELQTQIRNETGDNNYSVSANDITMKFTISHSSTAFTLDLSIDNTIARVIGFSAISSSGSTSYTSDKTFDLFGERYIVMHVNNFSSNIVSNQEKLEGAFAKIPITVPLFSIEYFIYDKLKAFKQFNPPLATLDYLNLEFRTYDGNLYDFNGQEHSLTFVVRTKTYRKNMQQVEI